MILIIFFIVHWYASIFLQSFFYHRYTAHRHFIMSRNTEKFFYISSFIVHGSSYMSPYAYGVMHRLHHVHTDTIEDPHSPINHRGFWSTMWQTRNSYNDIFIGKTLVDGKLEKDLPKWEAFDRIVHTWPMRVGWIIAYLLFYIVFASAWWMFLFLPITVIMCTFQGTVINWWAHKYGYVSFPMKNLSKNIIPVDLFFVGDAYHNNHHKFPGRPNNSHFWFEIDLTYQVTRLLGIVKVIKWKNQ
jgi:stearoyl-CoA desaturase (Delta-9 desaturase)